ncbi:MAG: hypothetical protein K2F71_05885 [Paramuribaculum sp.]|nr:hypothetical protein [Paramuribaculum sp.]
MAKKQNEEEIHTSIDELNDSLTGLTDKVQNNSRTIMWACIILAAIVAGVLIYVYAVRQPGIQKANDAIGEADFTLISGNDSLALEQYKAVAADYGYDAGNRARLQAAILLYQKGEYQQAIDQLDGFKATDAIIGANAYALKGDCYVNLDNNTEGLACFKKAVDQSDNNPYLTPAFLMKEANVYRAMADYKAEAAIYRSIIDNYPGYGQMIGADMQKYLRRAEIQAGE